MLLKCLPYIGAKTTSMTKLSSNLLLTPSIETNTSMTCGGGGCKLAFVHSVTSCRYAQIRCSTRRQNGSSYRPPPRMASPSTQAAYDAAFAPWPMTGSFITCTSRSAYQSQGTLSLECPDIAAADEIGFAVPWPAHAALVGRRAGRAATAGDGLVAGVDRRAALQQRMGGGVAAVHLQRAQQGSLPDHVVGGVPADRTPGRVLDQVEPLGGKRARTVGA